MIVKNEEATLKKCLDSIHDLCDEIAVVDTGSSDRTVEIASSYDNVKVYHFTWTKDFSEARNFAMSKVAHTDYSFTTDADEEFSPELQKTVRNLKDKHFFGFDTIDMWLFNQNGPNDGTYYLGGRQIVKNYPENVWKYRVHEKLYCHEEKSLNLTKQDGLIYHHHNDGKSSKSNYNKYTEFYFDELNSGKFTDLSYGAHFFYYLFLTMKNFDRNSAARYLPYAFDSQRFLADNEDVRINLWHENYINVEEFVISEALNVDRSPKFISEMLRNFSHDNAKYLAANYLHESGYGHFIRLGDYLDLALTSYNYGLMRDFESISKSTVDVYGDYGAQKHNVDFFNVYIKPILEEMPLVINCNYGCEHLPSLIYYFSNMFENIIILSKEDISDKFAFNTIKNVKFVADEREITGKRCVINANVLVTPEKALHEYENIMYDRPTTFISVIK